MISKETSKPTNQRNKQINEQNEHIRNAPENREQEAKAVSVNKNTQTEWAQKK